MKQLFFLFIALCAGILVSYGFTRLTEDNVKTQPVIEPLLVGNPNMRQDQADTIILSTGELLHRYDDADRMVTCYVVNNMSISCVKNISRYSKE